MLPLASNPIDDSELLEKIREDAKTPMTPQERREQIVSFVYSGRADNDTRTKKEIEESLEEQGLL